MEGGGYTFAALEAKFASSHVLREEVLTSGGKTDLPEFLAGITDVLTWGKSLIQFGQFAKSNMTYMELVSSPDPQCQSYVNWWPCVA